MNLSYVLAIAGRHDAANDVVLHGLALARRRGDRSWEQSLLTNLISGYYTVGRWDDVENLFAEIPEEGRIATNPVQASMRLTLALMALYRGQADDVVEVTQHYTAWAGDAHLQAHGVGLWSRVLCAQAEGRFEDALADSVTGLRESVQKEDPMGLEGFLESGSESALALESADALAELIELSEAGKGDSYPMVNARADLQRARLAVLRGEGDPPFERAVTALRELGEPFWLATALLEQAESLAARGRTDEIGPLLIEAREIFERLRVPPKLERVDRLDAVVSARVA